jgi:hypothetical protein
MTTQEKVAHLNKLTMSALTSEAAYLNQEDNDVRDYILQLRGEGHNIQMANDSHQYSESDLHVVDRLLAWITQIIHAEKVIKYEEYEMGALGMPEMYESLIDDAVAGLEKCLEQNPGGIEFFKIDGKSIVLVASPYYLFNECLIGNTAINDDFLEFVKLEEARLQEN